MRVRPIAVVTPAAAALRAKSLLVTLVTIVPPSAGASLLALRSPLSLGYCRLTGMPTAFSILELRKTSISMKHWKVIMTCALRLSLLLCATVAPLSFAARPSPPQLGPGRRYTTVERMELARLNAVREDRTRYARQRRIVPLRTGYEDYRAILHAHAEDSAHTGGTRAELLAAARATGVRIVMLTDHVRPPRDFIDHSWRGLRDGVLFIPGAEADGFLAYPARSILREKFEGRDAYIALVRRDGGNIFLSHVEDKLDHSTDGLDGLEIYNHHTDLMDERPFLAWLRDALADPQGLALLSRAVAEYPQEFFGVTQDYLAPIVAKWDRDSRLRPLTGIAANDCHHNQGFLVTAAGEDAVEIRELVDGNQPRRVTASQSPRVAELRRGKRGGEIIARLDFDPYERSLQYVTTHILAPELSEAMVRDALRRGRAYVGHDWLCDPTGFAFIAARSGATVAVMGDETGFSPGLTLRVAAPAPGIIRIFRDGQIVKEERAESLDYEASSPGVYRAEVWLAVGGEERPWIYANPIRLSAPKK
jgi:hypothetical protein